MGASIVFPDLESVQRAIERFAVAYMIVMTGVVIDALLDAFVEIYRTYEISRSRPIKSYLGVVRIVAWAVIALLVLSVLLDRSPLVFLSGLGALTAVLLLVFKDSLLGLVASVQIASQDMVRRGDWIEVPKYGADGDVIDVSLTTVKVQNWDHTITSLPTYALVSDSFKNWRGMTESEGRWIKRSVSIDMTSVRFLTPEMIDRFERIALIRDYVRDKRAALAETNRDRPESEVRINQRHLTNLGTFRAYVEAYVRSHPLIHPDLTLLVRQLAPGSSGIPIEVYAFSSDKNWGNYEQLQADLFDHILAVVPEFGLRVFQEPSGADLRALGRAPREREAAP